MAPIECKTYAEALCAHNVFSATDQCLMNICEISHPKKGSFVPSSSSANGATTLAKFSTSRIDPVQWKKKKLSTLASVAENQKSPNPKLD